MATNGGNLSENDFLDLEPVLDDDSFSLDMEVSDFEDLAVDSLVASAGDEYSEEGQFQDSLGTEFDFDTSSADLPETDSFSEASSSPVEDLKLDMDLDLDIEDPILDEKINEIVDGGGRPQEETNEPSHLEESDDFMLDELETDDEPITLSLEELENITADNEIYESKLEDAISQETPQNFDSVSSLEDSFEEDFAGVPEEEVAGFTDEELDQILGKDIFEDSDQDFSDESISLSGEELNQILADEDVKNENFDQLESEISQEHQKPSLESDLDFSFEDDSTTSTLLDGERDDLTPFSGEVSREEVQPIEETSTTELESSEIFGDEDIASEPITLSMDELSAITENQSSSDLLEQDAQDTTLDFEELNLGDQNISPEDSALLTESDESENLTLSDEELGNILGTDEEEPGEESSDLADMFDTEITFLPEESEEAALEESGNIEILPSEIDSFDEDFKADEDYSDEPITLSAEELSDIIGDVPPGEDLEERSELVVEKPLSPSIKIEPLQEEEIIDLDEFAEEGKASPLEELRHSYPAEKDVAVTENKSPLQKLDGEKTEDSELSAEDKKKVLLYLDNLLGNLPDDLIREFSKSSYFDLYKKLMKEIGV